MQITSELKQNVQDLETELNSKKREASRAESDSLQKKTEADNLWSRMTFRERYLRGWFGGDTETVEKYKNLRVLTEDFNQQASRSQSQSQALDSRIVTTIDKFLREQNDGNYLALVGPRDAADQMMDKVEDFIGLVETALSEIDDAQSMETMDLATNNAGISMMSTLENDEAKSAIKKVESAADAFQKAVQDYSESLKGFQVAQSDLRLGDTLDLMTDFAFDDGFDFMSIFTLNRLNEAEDYMEEVLDAVEKIEVSVNQNLEKADKAVGAYVQQIRLACV